MIRSSIDLGTNTCLLLVQGEGARTLGDFSTLVRLGQGVDANRKLHPEARERTLRCLRDYSQKLRALGGDPTQTTCVATSQARDSADGPEFFAQVERETGFRFEVISGEEEARLTFLGALLPGMEASRSGVIDIGGGSTEYIVAGKGQSLDLGSVRFTERFLKSDPVTDEEFWACQAEIDRLLAPLSQKGAKAGVEWVAVAGTATTLAGLQLGLARFDARAIDGCILTRGDIHRWVEDLKWRSVAERREIPSMEPARADVILAGALILWRSLEILGIPEVRVSTRGLRYGVLMSSKSG